MKWFKHDSDAARDAKIEKLMDRYGLEGYGLYFYCLELIARNVEAHNLTFELEHDAQLIARRLYKNADEIQQMMAFMVDIGLFELSAGGVVTCLKMATRTDEYTQKLLRKTNNCPDTDPTTSGPTPESVGTKSDLIEEKRREENRLTASSGDDGDTDSAFAEFWEAYPKKVEKKKSETAFRRLTKTKQLAALSDIRAGRFDGKQRQYIPNPTTYIHGERWNDEADSASPARSAKFTRGSEV